ncbi:dicarboxylate/amino acid:cation symporter [Saccharopolyspora erythraea]|uniref:dicarboxylate/amino acid:cation symporter n=1 Tax=Saccharopolyspora erythraea TaxID=1836 RepID=UPI0020113268|nr:dicarboxylate/amino acid:cation symporter [Saccharopolyspora erythraea]
MSATTGSETVPQGTDRPAGEARKRRWWRLPMGVQALLAMVVGAAIGVFAPDVGENMKILGDVFIRLVEMIVLPLVFPLIVLGITQMESVKNLGRLAWRTILYFEVITTVILLVAVGLAKAFDIGTGMPTAGGDVGQLPGDGKPAEVDFAQLLLHAVPDNVFKAFAEGNLLAVLLFAVFFGVGLAAVGHKAAPVRSVLDTVSEVMFKVVGFVIRLAPLGILGFLAYDVAHYGLSGLKGLVGFVGVVYFGLAVILLVVFPITAAIFRVRYVALLRAVGGLAGIAFVTRSSEAVLAPLLARLEKHGIRRSTASFVVPLGYSFNTDGSTLYQAVALVFLANAYGMDLSAGTLLTMVLVLVVLSKGMAGVASASIVVLMAAGKTLGLPVEGIALLMGVDFLADMARTAVNVFGNSLAAAVLDKSAGGSDKGAVSAEDGAGSDEIVDGSGEGAGPTEAAGRSEERLPERA